MSYFYLSCPYGGSDEQKKEQAQLAAKATKALLNSGLFVWSPIVHNHAMWPSGIEQRAGEEQVDLILEYNYSLLEQSQGMIVITDQGWKESSIIAGETALCEELEIPITYIGPKSLEGDFELDIELDS